MEPHDPNSASGSGQDQVNPAVFDAPALSRVSNFDGFIARSKVRADLISLPRRLLAFILLMAVIGLSAHQVVGLNIPPAVTTGTAIAVALLLIRWRSTVVPALAIPVVALTWLEPQGIKFVLLAILAAPVAEFFVFRGKRPRILLLRPFGEARMTSALKRVVLNHLSIPGTVLTLSDRNYKPSTTIRILSGDGPWAYLLGPILRPSLRIATVFDRPTLRLLEADLSGKLTLEAKSIYCGGQAFNIASIDAWWKPCIDLLMRSCEIIVMDLSKVGEGSTWEIVELGNRNLLNRCLFIVQESHSSDWLDRIRAALPSGYEPTVHVYKPTGAFIDNAAFQTAFRQRLATLS